MLHFPKLPLFSPVLAGYSKTNVETYSQNARLSLSPCLHPSCAGGILSEYCQSYAQEFPMPQDFEQRVRAVDAVTLTPLVRQALSQPTAEVLDWTSAPLAG